MDQTVSGASSSQGQDARAPLALKIAVIVMGVLLVAGFAVVIITIAYRAANPPAAGPAAAAVGEGGYETPVAIAAGAEIVTTTVAGERSLVTLRRGDGTYEVIVLDLDKGRLSGRFVLAPE